MSNTGICDLFVLLQEENYVNGAITAFEGKKNLSDFPSPRSLILLW